jgi:hypothetical protein
MSNVVAEPIPKRLFSPVAPSFLHECQFNILLIQSEKQQQQKQQKQQKQPVSPLRRLNSSEKNTSRKPLLKAALSQ